MATSYRYRDNAQGITHTSLKAFKHIEKLGKILSVKGYRFISTRRANQMCSLMTDHEAVLVKGEKGTARFEGLCWGYLGEGPRGLYELLVKLGVSPLSSAVIAFRSRRGSKPGVDWCVSVPQDDSSDFVYESLLTPAAGVVK